MYESFNSLPFEHMWYEELISLGFFKNHICQMEDPTSPYPNCMITWKKPQNNTQCNLLNNSHFLLPPKTHIEHTQLHTTLHACPYPQPKKTNIQNINATTPPP